MSIYSTKVYQENCKIRREAAIFEYIKQPKTCKQCGNVILFEKRNNLFCCSSCAATFNNTKRQARTLESKTKTSSKLKQINMKQHNHPPSPKVCVWCSQIHVRISSKYCSQACWTAAASQRASDRLSNPENRKNYGRQHRSWLEKSFEQWLFDHSITEFETEKHFKNTTLNKNYYVDFFFSQHRLIVELDGSQHRYTTEKDAIRDSYLRQLGYNVLRISHKDYQVKTHEQHLLNILLAGPP